MGKGRNSSFLFGRRLPGLIQHRVQLCIEFKLETKDGDIKYVFKVDFEIFLSQIAKRDQNW